MMWRAGVFVPVAAPSTLERAAAEQKGEHVFLNLLRRFTAGTERVRQEGHDICARHLRGGTRGHGGRGLEGRTWPRR